MLDYRSQSFEERVIVALDCDADKALAIANSLAGVASWVKVGMTLYYAQGPSIVEKFKNLGFNVFLDLKFHDIPHQVRGAAASAAAAGADMLTMHACGGADMMKAACEGATEGAEGNGLQVPALLGITVLTSMSADDLRSVGVSRELTDQVSSLAQLAVGSGLDGVVASPMEAAGLRSLLGDDALIVTPGVRPAGSDLGDQTRVATPRAAYDAGASHLVVGRPVVAADNPAAAFEAIAASL